MRGKPDPKITDRTEAYAWIAELYARTIGSQYVQRLDVSQVAPAFDRLVAVSIEVLDARDIPLKKLVAFRKREARHGGTDYSAMRRQYSATLQSYLQRIGKDAKTQSDAKGIEHQFKEDIKEDLADLKTELGLASIKALFSKEVALSALILAGSLVFPTIGLTTLATERGRHWDNTPNGDRRQIPRDATRDTPTSQHVVAVPPYPRPSARSVSRLPSAEFKVGLKI
jgi:hypothetical protein